MDPALELKIEVEQRNIVSFVEAEPYLLKSPLFNSLLAPLEETSLNLLHRLIQLSEIPYAQGFEKVQAWRDQLADMTFCEEGFSLSGKKDDLLACYNAMITQVLVKLEYPDTNKLKRGIDWILNYQNVARNQENRWPGKGIQKYGGCMKAIPCFIGVVKSMAALTDYAQRQEKKQVMLQKKLDEGIEYILEHQVFLRRSTGQPITKDITKLTYPFTYKTNVLEVLRLLKAHKMHRGPRTQKARALLLAKKKKEGHWKANAFYKPKHWVLFDGGRHKSEWLSHEVRAVLEED